METGTQRLLLVMGVFMFGVWGLTGGFGYLMSFIKAPGAGVGVACVHGTQIGCVTVTGQAGVQSCLNGQWTVCSPQIVPTTIVPPGVVTTIAPGGAGVVSPSLICSSSDGKVSYLTEVVDSLDYEAAGTTLIGSVTLYLTKAGAKVFTGTSSATGQVELTAQCPSTTEGAYVGIMALDDDNSVTDIYPVDTVDLTYTSGKLSGQIITYPGEALPLFYQTTDGISMGLVDAPVVIKTQKQGNLSIVLWDDSGTVTDKNVSLLSYAGVANSYGKFLIQEIDSDEAAQGITILIDYNTQNISDIYVEPASGSYKEDKGAIPSYYSDFDTAFRLYSDTAGTKPLTLDGSKLTGGVSNQIAGSIVITRKTTAAVTTDQEQNITLRVIDTMRYLEPGKYTWKGNGALYPEDNNYANLGIQTNDEPEAELIYEYA